WQFHVDFVNPSNSTLTGPTAISVAPFTEACGGQNPCIPEPAPGETLASLADRLMYRLAYRNFASHESLVVAHSITPSTGSSVSAVRWYEIRSPGVRTVVVRQ